MVYLTSTGFTFAPQLGPKVLRDYPTTISVAIITNAAEGKEENKYAQLAHRQLVELGYSQVKFVDLMKVKDIATLKSAGLIYVCGGNTYQLLHDLKSSGQTEWLQAAIAAGTGYIGVSAGSILVGHSIHTASIGEGDDNHTGLTDCTGLGIINHDISPHYTDTEESEIRAYEANRSVKVLRLADDQVLVFNPQTKELSELKKTE